MKNMSEIIDLKVIEAGQNVVNFCPETSVQNFLHTFLIALMIKAYECAPSNDEAQRMFSSAVEEATKIWTKDIA